MTHMTAPSGVPAGCICWRLRKAARRVSQIYDRHLVRYGLTVTQYAVLNHIRILDGIGVSALAGKLVMDPTTLTRNLRPLERKGLVLLVPDRHDKRNRNLHLTQAGRDAVEAAYQGWLAAQKEIAGVLGEDDGAALAGSIDRMLGKLCDT